MPRVLRRDLPASTLAALLLSAAGLAGCSSDSRVLARVGSRTITVGEFRDVASTAASRYLFVPPDSAKMLLLEDLVQRELLLTAAQGHPAAPDTFVARRRAEIEDETLRRELVQQLSPREVAVSEAEIVRLREWRETATHCQVVYTLDRSSAQAALDAIRRGEDFGSVAKRFDPSGMLPPAGDLGFVLPGGLISPLDRIVREAPVGSITGPVEAADQGWFLIHVVGREKRPPDAQTAEAMDLRSVLVQRKQRAALIRRYQELSSVYIVETDPAGVALFFNRFGMAERLRQLGAEPAAPELTDNDRRTVLGRWDGGARFRGVYTLGEAAKDLEGGQGGRLNGSNQLAVQQWVRSRILQHVATIEARRRHLNEEPEVAKRVRESLNNEILQAFYTFEVASKAEPTEEEVQAAYRTHVSSLATLRSVRVQFMTFPDSASAASAVQKAPRGMPLADAVLMASPRFRVREASVRFPDPDPIWTMLHDAFLRMPVGEIVGPILTPDGFRIVQLLERDAPVPDFESLPEGIRQGLRESAREAARERLLRQLTESLRRSIPVTIDRALLRRTPWPAPEGMQVMPQG